MKIIIYGHRTEPHTHFCTSIKTLCDSRQQSSAANFKVCTNSSRAWTKANNNNLNMHSAHEFSIDRSHVGSLCLLHVKLDSNETYAGARELETSIRMHQLTRSQKQTDFRLGICIKFAYQRSICKMLVVNSSDDRQMEFSRRCSAVKTMQLWNVHHCVCVCRDRKIDTEDMAIYSFHATNHIINWIRCAPLCVWSVCSARHIASFDVNKIYPTSRAFLHWIKSIKCNATSSAHACN